MARLGSIMMTIVIVAAVVGLTRFASHVTRQAQELTFADAPGAGNVIRTEVLHVWLPQTLFERSKHQSPQRSLELQGRENFWYAVTTRAHQVNGEFADVTFIRRPCDDPEHFPELLEFLAAAGGNPPIDPDANFSKAEVHIIAEKLPKRGPREVMAELLGHPSPARDQDRSP
jgi:hypothetical protein